MKVLEVLDSFYPNVDGPISVMVSLAQKMKELGLAEVDLLVPDYPEHRAEVEGIKIFRCKSVKYWEYRAAVPALDCKIRKIFKYGGYDIIHLHSPAFLGKYALRMGKRYSIPVVFTAHTKYRDELYKRIKSRLVRKYSFDYVVKLIDACDAVTSVSRGMVGELKKYGCKNYEKAKVIYNGTDMPAMAVDASTVAKLRTELGLNNLSAFIFVGRLTELKNVQFSLRALASAKSRGAKGFRFVIVGDGEYAKRLREIAEELGLTEEVVFVGKITDKKRISEYYSACDAMLFPSLFDNSSIAMQEAAANGLPTVAIAGSCSAELLRDGENGFVWENDEEVWADNLIRLISSPEEVRKAGEGALKTLYSDWGEIAAEYVKLYEEMIKDKKERGI